MRGTNTMKRRDGTMIVAGTQVRSVCWKPLSVYRRNVETRSTKETYLIRRSIDVPFKELLNEGQKRINN